MAEIRLKSIRIQNFRSIIDTGWKNLASDNITILIGQNESGKTSVLEGLESFYTGKIIEDVLRSDQNMPIVSCAFSIENNDSLEEIIDVRKLPTELRDKIKGKDEFHLTRKWNEDKSSTIYISAGEIFEFYNHQFKTDLDETGKTLTQIEDILKESDKMVEDLEAIESEKKEEELILREKRKILEDYQKELRKAKKPDIKIVAEKNISLAQTEYNNQEKIYIDKAEEYEEATKKANQLSEKIKVSTGCKEAIDNHSEIEQQIIKKQLEVKDYRHFYELSTSYKDQRRNKAKLDEATNNLYELRQSLEYSENNKTFLLKVAQKVINQGHTIKTAEHQAKTELESKKKYYTLEDLGEKLFDYIPVFEFFEDFSGLLPNKIDLEDILNEHEQVEGYKAARNFLKLAGLDAAFFREKNQRILKQRIATLNSDVTINFQDYWSQNVGKDSKIKLHFELEHYDYTVPEKSGKPYLEFWIKDNQESLYPKQRSRGVRWFLSFYLELKATQARKKGNRVLLIDEPGLSLHARAQEDVLKVFEDLKDSMQIIYCTHSPNLVNTDKLYRVLAVQRANDDEDTSETVIFEATNLSKASADTLTPVYSLMGVKLSENQVINRDKNIIVPDTITYYYLKWLSKIFPAVAGINFIPATNTDSLPLLINILESWQVSYGVVLFGDTKSNLKIDLETNTIFDLNKDENLKVLSMNGYSSIEDAFSTLDFKKYILLKREGITTTNFEYINSNGLSRKILATNFVNNFNNNEFSLENFDLTTRENLEGIFKQLVNLI